MCGRYTLTGDIDRYVEYFGAEEVRGESLHPNYNVAPTDPVYAIVEADGGRRLGPVRWGLLPFWAKDRRRVHINARVETIATKPAFRDAFRTRRCLIPADGFYEWQRLDQGKLPHYIHLRSGEPMGFAGVWSRWRDPETRESISTCAIVTGPPNRVVRLLHDRMPIVLESTRWDEWLDRGIEDVEHLEDLLAAPGVAEMESYPVSSLVNSVDNNLPELIDPLPEYDSAES